MRLLLLLLVIIVLFFYNVALNSCWIITVINLCVFCCKMGVSVSNMRITNNIQLLVSHHYNVAMVLMFFLLISLTCYLPSTKHPLMW